MATTKRNAQRRKSAPPAQGISPWRAYAWGVASGLVLALLVYLFTLPPKNPTPQEQAASNTEQKTPAPAADYIFYDHLSKQPGTPPISRNHQPRRDTAAENERNTVYLLQAGSFRQTEDADRRRAELLLLGLEAKVEAFNGSSGRLYRVYVGPFDTRREMSKARRLATSSQIETLVLKRPRS